MLRLAAAVAALCLAAPAGAHEHWINAGHYRDPVTGHLCCGDHDCFPQPAGLVDEVSGGYVLLETGETIPEARAIDSGDGQFWTCRYPAGHVQAGQIRCFFRPVAGS